MQWFYCYLFYYVIFLLQPKLLIFFKNSIDFYHFRLCRRNSHTSQCNFPNSFMLRSVYSAVLCDISCCFYRLAQTCYMSARSIWNLLLLRLIIFALSIIVDILHFYMWHYYYRRGYSIDIYLIFLSHSFFFFLVNSS